MWKPDVLLVGPGGIKGFIELGALLYIDKQGGLGDIKSYIGVSVGAIICYLSVVGYSIQDIITDCIDTDLLQSDTGSLIESLRENGGISSSNHIKKKLVDRTVAKLGRTCNFADLYRLTGYDLTIVATKLEEYEPVYYSHHNTPDEDVIDAILFSINIPGVFHKLVKVYTFIDGAFSDPYPVEYVDKNCNKVLGIYLEPPKINPSTSFKDYGYGCCCCPVIRLLKKSLEASSKYCRHLSLSSEYSDPLGIGLDVQKKSKMVVSGYYQTSEKFEKLFDDSIKNTTDFDPPIN